MKLFVVAVGNKMPRWVNEAFGEYAGRMPAALRVALAEVRPEPRSSGKAVAQLLAAEAERIERAIPRGCFRVALDEHGRELTTAQFATLLAQETAFVIGGADGLDPGLKKDAALLMRLSALTLPHALAQLVLVEQIYRAATLLAGHPYHRA